MSDIQAELRWTGGETIARPSHRIYRLLDSELAATKITYHSKRQTIVCN